MVQRASTILEHSRIVSNTHRNVRALDWVLWSEIFLCAGKNLSCWKKPVVLKNSTEHAEPLFIALTQLWSIEFYTRRNVLTHERKV